MVSFTLKLCPLTSWFCYRAEEAKVKLNTAKAAQHKAKVEEEQERRARMMEEAIQANKVGM